MEAQGSDDGTLQTTVSKAPNIYTENNLTKTKHENLVSSAITRLEAYEVIFGTRIRKRYISPKESNHNHIQLDYESLITSYDVKCK